MNECPKCKYTTQDWEDSSVWDFTITDVTTYSATLSFMCPKCWKTTTLTLFEGF